MLALVAGIHVFDALARKTWIAGSSSAMAKGKPANPRVPARAEFER
jgi:hypothetical protein